jgi:hypothetical protein
MTVRKRMTLAAGMFAALCSCAAYEDQAGGIQGQWALELVRSSDAPRSARGVVVFGDDLRAYPGPPALGVEQPYTVGRYYMDLRPLWGQAADERYLFSSQPESDLIEETVAKLDSGGVFIILAPHVVGARVELRGAFGRDTIKGTWMLPDHRSGTPARGNFTMTRVPADAFTDSARARSRHALGR